MICVILCCNTVNVQNRSEDNGSFGIGGDVDRSAVNNSMFSKS